MVHKRGLRFTVRETSTATVCVMTAGQFMCEDDWMAMITVASRESQVKAAQSANGILRIVINARDTEHPITANAMEAIYAHTATLGYTRVVQALVVRHLSHSVLAQMADILAREQGLETSSETFTDLDTAVSWVAHQP